MLNAASAALHLLSIRKELLSFSLVKYWFCRSFVSQHHERHKRQKIHQKLDTDPAAERVISPPFWICVFLIFFFFWMDLNMQEKKKERKKMTEQSMFTPLHRFKYMEQWWH